MIGDKLRLSRQTKKMTIAQLSEQTGFSSGYISSVERGHVNPSLSALLKISSALDLDTGVLFESRSHSNSAIQVVRKGERLTLVYPGSNFRYELLTRDLTMRKVEFIRVIIPVGKSSGTKPLTHDGEEYGLVLKGRIQLLLGDETYILHDGDSVSFQSTIPHSVINIGKTDAEAIWVFTPPRL